MNDKQNPANSQIPSSPVSDSHQDIPPPPVPAPPPGISYNADIEPSVDKEPPKTESQPANSLSTPVSDTYIPTPESVSPPSPPPTSSGNRTKFIGAIAAVILLVIAIPAGIFLTSRSQDVREKAAVGDSCSYGETCPGGGVQVCQGVKQLNSNGDEHCSYTGPCSGCENPAICGNGACEPGEGPDNCADCQSTETKCANGGQQYNPGDKRYDCTGNKASCRGEAGEGVPYVCNADGSWSVNGSECTNSCPVGDNSNCEYRETCTTSSGASGTKLCSGTKDSANVCKYNAAVSSCGDCETTPAQSCSSNKNYEAGLLPGKTNPDPNCSSNGGSYCNDGGTKNVCCYGDGNCYEGQQGSCKDKGGGTIELSATAEIIEFNCSGQTTSSGSCPENRTSRGTMGPGTYSVSTGCGGKQIDAVGYCGSYKFNGACAPAGGPSPTIQCLDIKIYTTAGVRITDPVGTIKPGDTIRLSVSGNTNASGGLSKARFRTNGGVWQETAVKNAAGEYYLDVTVSAGAFSIEAQVFSPVLGWE